MALPEDTPTVAWRDGAVELIDQAALPNVERTIRATTLDRVAEAIRTLEVRGAPAIGVTAALGLGLVATQSVASTTQALLDELERAGDLLVATRPTAVNLAWAVNEVLDVAERAAKDGAEPDAIAAAVLQAAVAIGADDLARCHAIGANGAALLAGLTDVITHCNAGALATAGYGTALGVIRSAHAINAELHVWADETRPILQGARLTSYELRRDGIATTVIVDGAAASVLRQGRIGAAVVGADRIAANGDVANKIGTYGLAIACRYHGVPFYVAAPLSTIDAATATGAHIEIEERSPDEILTYPGAAAYNPAFDVTPAELVTAIITEVGVLRDPYPAAIAVALEGSA